MTPLEYPRPRFDRNRLPSPEADERFRVVIVGAGVAGLEAMFALRARLSEHPEGGKPCYLTAKITGGAGFASGISDSRDWHPDAKIAAPHLTPVLQGQDLGLTLAGHA